MKTYLLRHGFQHLFVCAAVAEDIPHQAQAGQKGQAEPSHSTVDPLPHRQQDQVSELFRSLHFCVGSLATPSFGGLLSILGLLCLYT